MPAKPGNKNALGNKGGGRKSSFKPEYVEQALKLCKLGATEDDMAEFFQVGKTTLHRWKTERVEFAEALKAGKMLADAEVANKLYHRATGYSHSAIKFLTVGGEVVREDYIEHYPPDTTACIFWLKNRQPKLWRAQPDDKSDDDTPQPVKIEVKVVDARKRSED